MRQDKTVPKTVKSHSIHYITVTVLLQEDSYKESFWWCNELCHLNVISLYLLISFLILGHAELPVNIININESSFLVDVSVN